MSSIGTSLMWQAEYLEHRERLDARHRRLMMLIFELHDAVRSEHGRAAVERLLDDLVDATDFSEEESLMREGNYPSLGAHVEEHRRIAEIVLEIRRGFRDHRMSLTLEMLSFLSAWLNAHILMDRDYASYLRRAGVNSKRPSVPAGPFKHTISLN